MNFVKVIFLVTFLAGAQAPPAGLSKAEELSGLVKKQFGSTFTIGSVGDAPTTLLVADFDGDGVPDVAIVADSKDPLPDSYDFKYTVTDPYNSFYGFGNPSMTAGFNRSDPKHNHDLLIIFGAGAENWHSTTPKAKFVLINVPFDTIEVGRLLIKKDKPPIYVIKAVESDIMDSSVYWDVKKKRWKWQPGNTFQ
jgi:hypothetical protein